MGMPLVRPLPIAGERFGHWTVTGDTFSNGQRLVVPVECDCGTTAIVHWTNLRRGSSTNCGCQKQAWNKRHGESRTRLYAVWAGIIQRCYDPNCAIFKHYGGRGIKMGSEWRHSYESFALWARTNGYDPSLEVDRIDNNGDYEPTNCRFVTHRANMRNTRVNYLVTAWGETKPFIEWVEDDRCSVGKRTLYSRLTRSGWEPERAISAPKLH